MSLSERLKVAEQARRRSSANPSTADPADTPGAAAGQPAVLDVSGSGAAVIDLTSAPSAAPAGITYSPLRSADGSGAFTDVGASTRVRTAGIVCPRCGGPTQLDLFDQVHQTASLSCSSCFHMFRVELGD
jgi:hypothetical protein